MTVPAAPSLTWTYLDGDWHEGNVPIMGPRSHAAWLASQCFDGARWFDGVAPDLDLHLARCNGSADGIGLRGFMDVEETLGIAADGFRKFDGSTAVYVKPMYWAESGGYMSVPPDPDSTRFCLCLFEAPMIAPSGFSLTVSPFRRPTPETAMTETKSGALYPNNGRMVMEAKSRGFDNALSLDMMGNVAETGTSNIFMARDGVVFTPAANGCFLAGITRARSMKLLRAAGIEVREERLTPADFMGADEIWSTGNHSKVVPVNRIEDRDLQPGPIGQKLRELYMDWAHSLA